MGTSWFAEAKKKNLTAALLPLKGGQKKKPWMSHTCQPLIGLGAFYYFSS